MTVGDEAGVGAGVGAGVPLWRRIAQTLSGEIGPKGLGPGERLATEAQLAARFQVNRHTVRRALEAMVRTGLVRVEQGRGTFVADDVIDYAVTGRTRFNEWIRRQNREPLGEVLHVKLVASTALVAAGLDVERGSMVVVLERLGKADGVPVSVASHYFVPGRLPGIVAALRAEATISGALARVGVADYRRLSTRVSARMPTVVEAELLAVSRARPVLVCENTNVDGAGVVVEFGVARYPSGRVQVVFEP